MSLALTPENIGRKEWNKAIDGRRAYYAGDPADGTPNGCRNCAMRAGNLAALSLRILQDGIKHERSTVFLDRYTGDAVMYAKMAARAWRSYRSFPERTSGQ